MCVCVYKFEQLCPVWFGPMLPTSVFSDRLSVSRYERKKQKVPAPVDDSLMLMLMLLSVAVVPLAAAVLLQAHSAWNSSAGPAGSPELIGDPKLARSALSGQIRFQSCSDDGLSPLLRPSSPPPLPQPTPPFLSLQLVVKKHRRRHHVRVSFPVPTGSVEKGGGVELNVTGKDRREERRKRKGR